MIDKIKKLADIWLSLPLVPRRLALFLFFGGAFAYLVIRTVYAIQDPTSIADMTLLEFLGF